MIVNAVDCVDETSFTRCFCYNINECSYSLTSYQISINMNNYLFKMRGRLYRLQGNIVKLMAKVYHRLAPSKRWDILSSPAKVNKTTQGIPLIIWQTNFSNRVTWPFIVNHHHNRARSKEFEYRYVSTEAREEYLRNNAPQKVLDAYMKLTDGAAQADVWRLFVLYKEGGVYMDFDATLLRSLYPFLSERDSLFINNYDEFTNFFMATKPQSKLFKEFLDQVVSNIENYQAAEGKSVYDTTGPGALKSVLKRHPEIKFEPHNIVCAQGVFTNEYFQYIDKPRSKWIYKKTFIKGLDGQ